MHLLLDQKIGEVVRMRDVLAKELEDVNAMAEIKERVVVALSKVKQLVEGIQDVVEELKQLPNLFSHINTEWGRILFHEKHQSILNLQ